MKPLRSLLSLVPALLLLGIAAGAATLEASTLTPYSLEGAALLAGVALLAWRVLPALNERGGFKVWKEPLDIQALEDLANPNRTDLETYPDFLYDVQTYPTAGTAQLNFYGTVSPDPTITNMEAQGMLPAQNWFQPYSIHVTPLIAQPSNLAVSAAPADQIGILNDWSIITGTGRAILTLTIQRKDYGPWHVICLHGVGGAVGFFTQGITAAAAAVGANQAVMNGPADDGFGPQGEIVIPPLTPFSVSLQLRPGGLLAISRDTPISVEIFGRRYRGVR